MTNSDTFFNVTNSDIYHKLGLLEDKMERVLSNQQLTRWMAATALAVSLSLIGFIIKGG